MIGSRPEAGEATEIYRQVYDECQSALDTSFAKNQRVDLGKIVWTNLKYFYMSLTLRDLYTPHIRIPIEVLNNTLNHSVFFPIGGLRFVYGQARGEMGDLKNTAIVGIGRLGSSIRKPKEILVLAEGEGNRLVLGGGAGVTRPLFDEDKLVDESGRRHPELGEKRVDLAEAKRWEMLMRSFEPFRAPIKNFQ